MVVELIPKQDRVLTARVAIHDWLRIEFGIDRPGRALEAPEWLDADSFVAAVRAALPRRRHLSAAEIGRLKREHADTVAPARQAAAEALRLERRLSDLVNQAYGLTPEEVALMGSTAPPECRWWPPLRRNSSAIPLAEDGIAEPLPLASNLSTYQPPC